MASYDAFISYSHAKDKPIAAALQSVVQTLGKPWYKRRSLRLFRDDTSLSATPHLWPSIELALGQSRFLILLASADSARSPWVGKEVAYWLDHKSIDTLLIAVTDGEVSWDPAGADFTWSEATPLPVFLKGRFPTEPKWVDLRAYRDGASKGDRRFTELGADFAAAIHDVPKEDLLSEEVRQQRRALSLAWSAVVLLMMLGGAAGWQWRAAVKAEQLAIEQKQVAQQQRDLATAAEHTATEQKQIAEQQRDRATEAERSATEQQKIAVQQRDRAERTLTAATKTANGLVFDLAVKFREVKGIPLDVVQGILDRGKGLLDDLVSFNETSPAVQLNRVTTWSELGFTLAQQGSAEGGTLAAEAYQIATALGRDHPGLDGFDYAMGRAAEVLGQLREREDPQAAYALNQEADVAFEKCFDQRPKDLECLKHEFTAVGRIGNILFDNKQYNDALTVYQKSLELALTYQRMAAPGPEVGLHIGGRHNHLGRTYFQLRNPDEALREFKLAQSSLEPWASAPKASTTFLFELSSTYNNIGSVLASKAKSDRGKLQEAIGYTERAAKLLEALAASDPGHLFYWSNLAMDYDNLEFLNGLIGNRSAQESYARKRQQAMERAKVDNSRPVAQTPSP
jgi:tetratricopeptide (TPR) repeat protein